MSLESRNCLLMIQSEIPVLLELDGLSGFSRHMQWWRSLDTPLSSAGNPRLRSLNYMRLRLLVGILSLSMASLSTSRLWWTRTRRLRRRICASRQTMRSWLVSGYYEPTIAFLSCFSGSSLLKWSFRNGIPLPVFLASAQSPPSM